MRTLTYEFIVPSQIWSEDASDWPLIAVTRHDLPMRIQKPIVGHKLVTVDFTLGNEGVDLHYSIMRVDVDVPDEVTTRTGTFLLQQCGNALRGFVSQASNIGLVRA